jgi:hypothetical protein
MFDQIDTLCESEFASIYRQVYVRAKYPKAASDAAKVDIMLTLYVNNKASGRYTLTPKGGGVISVDDMGHEIWTAAQIDGKSKKVEYFSGDPSILHDVAESGLSKDAVTSKDRTEPDARIETSEEKRA